MQTDGMNNHGSRSISGSSVTKATDRLLPSTGSSLQCSSATSSFSSPSLPLLSSSNGSKYQRQRSHPSPQISRQRRRTRRSGNHGILVHEVGVCASRFIVLVLFAISMLWFVRTTINNEEKSLEFDFMTNAVEEVASFDFLVPSSEMTTNKTTFVTIDENDVDWDDPIFNFTETEWDMSPIILREYKLMFFTVPKVACTVFKQLFRRMKGLPGWRRDDVYQPHDVTRNRLDYLGRLPRTKQLELITSSEWTRAIFVRDPFERSLSAYLDKGLRAVSLDYAGEYIKNKCCGMKKKNGNLSPVELNQEIRRLIEANLQHCVSLLPYEKPMNETTFPFEMFISSFVTTCDNEHWRPQSRRIRPKNWKFINFVGHFDNLQMDTKRLLERIGAYDKYGKSGWGTYRNDSIFEYNTALHATKSRSKLGMYYNQLPEGPRSILQKYYQDDYNHPMLGLSSTIIYQ